MFFFQFYFRGLTCPIKHFVKCGLIFHFYGFLLILNCFLYLGKVREKFPLEMAEIQGAVVAADINDDGKIELVTADTHGNVAAWTTKGEEIWEVHLKSLVPQVRFMLFSF